jgi:hypothetical protein
MENVVIAEHSTRRRKNKAKYMDIKDNNQAITSDSIPAQTATNPATREAYSTPKITEFGTVQSITAGHAGSNCRFRFAL